MRKLALFSFLFAAGCIPVLLGWPPVLRICLGVFSAAVCIAGFLLKGRKERIAAICAMGCCFGILWSSLYHLWLVAPVLRLEEEMTEVRVTLTDYPQMTDYGWTAQGIAEKDGKTFRTVVLADEALKLSACLPGDVISGFGDISAQGDTETGIYRRSMGFHMQVSLCSDARVEPADRIPVRYWPAVLSHKLRETAEALYPQDVRGYVIALLTGDKSGITDLQQSDLKIAGVYHALAVSGMHVSILMSVLAVVTLKNRRIYPLIGIPMLMLYCLMIGNAASVVRASVMHIFLMAAGLLRRESDAPTAMGASLLVLMLENPWSLLNLGLQLSFLATGGILAFCKPLFDKLIGLSKRKKNGISYAVCSVTATNVSALSLTLPLMAVTFGMVSTLSIVSNLLVLNAITAAFFFSFLSCFGAWIAPWLGNALAFPVIWLLRYTEFCCRMIAKLPCSAIYPESMYLKLWLGAAYVLLVCFLLFRKKFRRRAIFVSFLCVALSLCAALVLTRQERLRGSFRFTALDVGQGQCLLLTSGKQIAAIDCGGYEAGSLLADQLLAWGDRRLDVLILSHYDPEHTNGLEMLLHRVEVGRICLPDVTDDTGVWDSIDRLAREYGTEIQYISEEKTIPLGTGELHVFAPKEGATGNGASLPVLACFDGFDIFAAGDLTAAGETALLRAGVLPDLEVLVAGNHGAEASTTPLLLHILKPEAVVISVGESMFGMPSESVLTCAEEIGAAVYRTDLHGNIVIRR